MKRLELPDSSIVVKKVIKYADTDRPSATSVDMYLGEGVDIGGGTGGAIVGKGKPTRKTKAELGQTYLDEDSNEYYVLNSINGNQYLWQKIDIEEYLSAEKYGEIDYYSIWEESYGLQWGQNVVLNRVDSTKYEKWLADNPGVMSQWGSTVNFDYRNEIEPYWQVWADTGQIMIPADEIYETTGLELEIEDPSMSWAYCSVEKTVTVDKESEIKTIDIFGQSQINALSNPTDMGNFIELGEKGITINSRAVYKVRIDISKIDTFPDYFLAYCKNLVRLDNIDDPDTEYCNLNFNSGIEVGSYFLHKCCSLNYSNLTLQFQNAKIGDYFMYQMYDDESGDTIVAEKIYFYMWNGGIIGESFLSNNRGYTGQIVIGVHSELSIGRYFCGGNERVSSIEASMVENIPNQYLDNNYVASITLNNTNITKQIGYSFLGSCQNFNQNLDFRDLETIGDGFMENCTGFNSSISMPSVRSIGSSFMYSNTAFTQYLELPSLVKVGSSFMADCTNFSQSISFPSLLIVDFGNFMYNCNLQDKNVTFGNSNLTEINAGTYAYRYALAMANEPSIPTTIIGPRVQYILNLLPNSSSSPYRNLADGGTGGGGGTTYTFTDTNDGWKAEGSDGSIFTHTDKSPSVVQSTGQSTTSVMSQKAVTDIIGDLETALSTINNGGNS